MPAKLKCVVAIASVFASWAMSGSVAQASAPITGEDERAAAIQSFKLGPADLQAVEPEVTSPQEAGAHLEAGDRDVDDVLTTGVIEAGLFELAALSWDPGADADALKFYVRARHTNGRWSSWFDLHDDGHGAESNRAESKGARGGTEPLITPGADAIEVRIDVGEATWPHDLHLHLVDPGYNHVDAHVAAAESATATASLRPSIYSRAQWGADESIREPGDPLYGDVRGAFVHHTAGTNAYDPEDVPGIIRSIYSYHVNGRGWRDIGYNFLVDRFGRTWEGRYGGVNRPVIGAHASGYNSYSVGASVLGTYSTKTVEPAVVDALADLFAWKFTIHGISPMGAVQYPGGNRLRTISGHRDGGSTECPGDALYAKLGILRNKTAEGVQLNSSLVGIGDLNSGGPGVPDVIARRTDGTLWLYPGRGDGSFYARRQVGSSAAWNQYTALVGVGDVTSDGIPDMIARHRDGTLWLYSGRGDGNFEGRVQIGTSEAWGQYTALSDTGDITGDGIPDMIARHHDGTLWLYAALGNGAFESRTQIGESAGWGQYE